MHGWHLWAEKGIMTTFQSMKKSKHRRVLFLTKCRAERLTTSSICSKIEQMETKEFCLCLTTILQVSHCQTSLVWIFCWIKFLPKTARSVSAWPDEYTCRLKIIAGGLTLLPFQLCSPLHCTKSWPVLTSGPQRSSTNIDFSWRANSDPWPRHTVFPDRMLNSLHFTTNALLSHKF